MSSQHKKTLGQLEATAICGNDISSSVLYVSALAIAFAGQYAWVTLLIVSFVLLLYRKIYAEVVGALPLNGGAYNALLNTTSKRVASFAATLTLLSYMATAVISGNEAIHYLHHIVTAMPVIPTTIALIGFFAALVIFGISESAKVAVVIFLFHLSSLVILTGFCIYFFSQNGSEVFMQNWRLPIEGGNLTHAIFLGFAASMLGVSGFESSANFVEEQKAGVFPKTLRNMWIIVSIFNPLMAVLALMLFALPVLQSPEYQNTLLVEMGKHVGGSWLAYLIAIDAFLVLSGAVLTSFVGVTGLLERMALDRVLPPFFLKKNKRGSSYRIIITFFLLCVSVLLITQGDVRLLAGVYTISFLSVMALFAIGNILLKLKRKQIPRPVKASWISVITAIIAVLIALIGNITMEHQAGFPSNIVVFSYYFIPSITFVLFMLNRTYVFKVLLSILESAFGMIDRRARYVEIKLQRHIDHIKSQEFVFFSKGDNLPNLNRVMLYIIKNEHTKKLKIVTLLREGEMLPESFYKDIAFLDREYPQIVVTAVTEIGEFGPEKIKELSDQWAIPINFMFIGSPGEDSTHRIEELGGVRLIT